MELRFSPLFLTTSHYAFVLALHRPPSQAKNESYFSQRYHIVQVLSCLTLTSSLRILSVAISLAMIHRPSNFGSDTTYIRMAGALVKFPLSSVSAGRINERWESGMPHSDTKYTDTLDTNCRLRASFTAMCATVFHLHSGWLHDQEVKRRII